MTVGVDCDGVIHRYSRGWHDGTLYDELMPGAREALRALLEVEPTFIHTTRDPGPVVDYLRGYDLPAFADDTVRTFWNERGRLLVTNRKLAACCYVDDRAVPFTGWPGTLEAVAAFSPAVRAQLAGGGPL